MTVEEGAVVRDCVIFDGCRIGKGAHVEYAVVTEDTVIPAHTFEGVPRGEGGGEPCVIDGAYLAAHIASDGSATEKEGALL